MSDLHKDRCHSSADMLNCRWHHTPTRVFPGRVLSSCASVIPTCCPSIIFCLLSSHGRGRAPSMTPEVHPGHPLYTLAAYQVSNPIFVIVRCPEQRSNRRKANDANICPQPDVMGTCLVLMKWSLTPIIYTVEREQPGLPSFSIVNKGLTLLFDATIHQSIKKQRSA